VVQLSNCTTTAFHDAFFKLDPGISLSISPPLGGLHRLAVQREIDKNWT
jgi:hypothetical protein